MKLNTTFPLKEISTVQDDAIKWYYLNFVQFCCLQIPREGEGEDSGKGKCASPKGNPGYVPHVAQLHILVHQLPLLCVNLSPSEPANHNPVNVSYFV